MRPKVPVLILGGSGEIGASIADRFRAAGHEVVASGRNDFDLSDSRSITKWFEQPHPEFGVLIHSAGFNAPKLFKELTDIEIRDSLRVNVEGFLEVTRQLLPGVVRANGRIVILSSIFGFLSRSGRLPYTMSKHALIGATKALAIELGKDGVLVNSVSPGYIDTKLTSKNNDEATIKKLIDSIPLARLGSTKDVAEVVYFLGSELNGYITGQNIVVDGGISIDGGRK